MYSSMCLRNKICIYYACKLNVEQEETIPFMALTARDDDLTITWAAVEMGKPGKKKSPNNKLALET